MEIAKAIAHPPRHAIAISCKPQYREINIIMLQLPSLALEEQAIAQNASSSAKVIFKRSRTENHSNIMNTRKFHYLQFILLVRVS
jgi:hypothetical protein